MMCKDSNTGCTCVSDLGTMQVHVCIRFGDNASAHVYQLGVTASVSDLGSILNHFIC